MLDKTDFLRGPSDSGGSEEEQEAHGRPYEGGYANRGRRKSELAVSGHVFGVVRGRARVTKRGLSLSFVTHLH